jgi:plasmid stabilization system protein ParE
MTARRWRVVFTATAVAQVEIIATWWQQERSAAPDLFATEFAAAVERLAGLPGSGAPFHSKSIPAVRRVLLPGCRYHLYYTLRRGSREVIVRAVWHAMRGTAPDLG